AQRVARVCTARVDADQVRDPAIGARWRSLRMAPVRDARSARPGSVADVLSAQASRTVMRLRDKVAIITGAGTGIGEAIAHKFAREGARLVVSGLPADPVQDVAEAIASAGGQVQPHLGDLAEELDARACVQLALQSFGSLDVLVS